MSDAVQALLRQAVEEASREAIAAARAEGFAAGLREGMARATRDMRVRLNQLLVDTSAGVVLGDDLVLGNASGPGSVASCGSRLAAREDTERRGGRPRAVYRTAARDALVVGKWPLGMPVAELRPMLARLPGPLLPAELDLSQWAERLGVSRPEGFNAQRAIRAAPAVVPKPIEKFPGVEPRVDCAGPPVTSEGGEHVTGSEADQRFVAVGVEPAATLEAPSPPPHEAVEDDDAPVALAPAGSVRETPGLVRARELLAMGLGFAEIRQMVRLTALEVEALVAERAQVAA